MDLTILSALQLSDPDPIRIAGFEASVVGLLAIPAKETKEREFVWIRNAVHCSRYSLDQVDDPGLG
jgi:hypothetical protein